MSRFTCLAVTVRDHTCWSLDDLKVNRKGHWRRGGAENAGLQNADWNCRTGKCRTWKMPDL